MEKESNYYYEPTIKTARKEKYPKRMFFENYEYIPKQQLISFLENKIKKHKFDESLTYKKIEINACVRNAYQEVLDFVTKGGKE